MSLTIHYRGKLDDRAVLPELLEAARLFCSQEGWLYNEVDERISGRAEHLREVDSEERAHGESVTTESAPIEDTLFGLVISPYPTSDPLWLTFNAQGELCFYLPLNNPGEYWEMKILSTRTQSAPLDIHIGICELLHTIQRAYFPGLSVFDEGGYFETGEVDSLEAQSDESDASEEELEARLQELDPDDPSTAQIRRAINSMQGNGGARRRRKPAGKPRVEMQTKAARMADD